MKAFTKKDYDVSKVRRFLEPGPIVLVSSAWKGETNIMTMGWHTVMEFTPSRIGCMISSGNHSFGLIKASKELVEGTEACLSIPGFFGNVERASFIEQPASPQTPTSNPKTAQRKRWYGLGARCVGRQRRQRSRRIDDRHHRHRD